MWSNRPRLSLYYTCTFRSWTDEKFSPSVPWILDHVYIDQWKWKEITSHPYNIQWCNGFMTLSISSYLLPFGVNQWPMARALADKEKDTILMENELCHLLAHLSEIHSGVDRQATAFFHLGERGVHITNNYLPSYTVPSRTHWSLYCQTKVRLGKGWSAL